MRCQCAGISSTGITEDERHEVIELRKTNVDHDAVVEDWLVSCCLTGVVSFEKNLEVNLRLDGIEPWSAQELVLPHLERRCALAGRSALRFVPTIESITAFRGYFKMGSKTPLSRAAFLFIAKDLVANYGNNGSTNNANGATACDSFGLLHAIFAALALDGKDELSLGELALGLPDFLAGSLKDKSAMVCEFLDRDGDKHLTTDDMREYLSPLLSVMIPPNAKSLKPLLLTRCANEILKESCSTDQEMLKSKVTCESFQDWWVRHSVVDELCRLVDAEVYKVWLEQSIRGVPEPLPSAPVNTYMWRRAEEKVAAAAAEDLEK